MPSEKIARHCCESHDWESFWNDDSNLWVVYVRTGWRFCNDSDHSFYGNLWVNNNNNPLFCHFLFPDKLKITKKKTIQNKQKFLQIINFLSSLLSFNILILFCFVFWKQKMKQKIEKTIKEKRFVYIEKFF